MSKKIPAVLIDFDGVLKIGSSPAPGAGELLKFISESGIPSLILSNSSLNTGDDIIDFLRTNSIDFNIPALTAANAAKEYIAGKFKKISVYCADSVMRIFQDYIDDKKPEAVLVGDIGEKWNYITLNEIFRKVLNGAELIAFHKNKFWKPDGVNLSLDAGPFITAIEYASSKKALLIGKPSPVYFQTALLKLGLKPDSNFIMIGDDIENDIYAVSGIGGMGILVYTGKTEFPLKADQEKPLFEAFDLIDVLSILRYIDNNYQRNSS